MNHIIKLSLIFTSLFLFASCAAKKDLVDLNQKHQNTLEEHQQLETNLQSELRLVNEQNANLYEENAKLQEENTQLRYNLMMAEELIHEINSEENQSPETIEEGIIFRVQIGAYKERVLSEAITTSENLDTDQKNGLQKTVVGQFRDYQKANKLKEQLKAMGVQDAWIVSYKDGVRVSIKAALSELGMGK